MLPQEFTKLCRYYSIFDCLEFHLNRRMAKLVVHLGVPAVEIPASICFSFALSTCCPYHHLTHQAAPLERHANGGPAFRLVNWILVSFPDETH